MDHSVQPSFGGKKSMKFDSWIFMAIIFGQYVYAFSFIFGIWLGEKFPSFHVCRLSPSRTSMNLLNLRACICDMELLRNQSWKIFFHSFRHIHVLLKFRTERPGKNNVRQETHTME